MEDLLPDFQTLEDRLSKKSPEVLEKFFNSFPEENTFFDVFCLVVDERLHELESKAFRNTRKSDTSRAQQMLLLKYLGLLDKIRELGLSKWDCLS